MKAGAKRLFYTAVGHVWISPGSRATRSWKSGDNISRDPLDVQLSMGLYFFCEAGAFPEKKLLPFHALFLNSLIEGLFTKS